MDLNQLAAQAGAVLRQAGELIRSIPHPAVYSKEGHANFVTEADMASQNFLLERLAPLFPPGPLFRRGAGRAPAGPRLELDYRPH